LSATLARQGIFKASFEVHLLANGRHHDYDGDFHSFTAVQLKMAIFSSFPSRLVTKVALYYFHERAWEKATNLNPLKENLAGNRKSVETYCPPALGP